MIGRSLAPVRASADRLRNPSRTGENRCFRCTLVDLALGTAASVVVAAAAPVVGLSLFVLSLASVYLRGSLPVTAPLTERYLRGREDRPPGDRAVREGGGSRADRLEPASFLRRHGALTDEEGAGPELTPTFEAAWRDRMLAHATDADLLDTLLDDVFADVALDRCTASSLRRRDDAVVLDAGGRSVARWESRAAVVADAAAAAALSARSDEWHALAPDARSRILGTLRLCLERCPTCRGPISLRRDPVETPRRSALVIAGSCDHCGSRLFEVSHGQARDRN